MGVGVGVGVFTLVEHGGMNWEEREGNTRAWST